MPGSPRWSRCAAASPPSLTPAPAPGTTWASSPRRRPTSGCAACCRSCATTSASTRRSGRRSCVGRQPTWPAAVHRAGPPVAGDRHPGGGDRQDARRGEPDLRGVRRRPADPPQRTPGRGRALAAHHRSPTRRAPARARRARAVAARRTRDDADRPGNSAVRRDRGRDLLQPGGERVEGQRGRPRAHAGGAGRPGRSRYRRDPRRRVPSARRGRDGSAPGHQRRPRRPRRGARALWLDLATRGGAEVTGLARTCGIDRGRPRGGPARRADRRPGADPELGSRLGARPARQPGPHRGRARRRPGADRQRGLPSAGTRPRSSTKPASWPSGRLRAPACDGPADREPPETSRA